MQNFCLSIFCILPLETKLKMTSNLIFIRKHKNPESGHWTMVLKFFILSLIVKMTIVALKVLKGAVNLKTIFSDK